MKDARVFELTRSRITPPPTPEQEARTEAFDEAVLIARLYEERGANAGAVRLALEARARTLLDEASFHSDGDASSSGATEDLPPRDNADGNAPLPTYDDMLGHICRVYDEVLRALGTPEPQSRKAFPKLRRVK